MVSTDFRFDGIESREMGLSIIKLDGGFTQIPIGGSVNIITEKIPYKDIPYITRSEKELMSTTLTFTFLEEDWTPEKIEKIAKWLFVDRFKEFQTYDDLGKVYYVYFPSQKDFYTVNNKQGYFQLECVMLPFSFSPKTIIQKDFSELYNAQSATNTTLTLYNGSSSTNDIYNGETLYIIEGTGSGQSKVITDYDGTTKIATFNTIWDTLPDNTSRYYITKSIQANVSNTVTLHPTASSVDDYYIGRYIYIESGIGIGQYKRITDYNGTTKIATLESSFSTTLNNTSKYLISNELILENRSNVMNNGRHYYTPKYIEFEMKGSTYFAMFNTNDSNREFSFNGINNNEIIKVNDLNEIYSSVSNTTYRYPLFNKKWLRLAYGQNKFQVIGRCKLETLMEFPMYR